MVGRAGVEPSRRYPRPTPLAGEPLQPLGYCSIWRKVRDLNPHCAHHATLVFRTSLLPIRVTFHDGLKVECAFPHLKLINTRDKSSSPVTTGPCRLVLTLRQAEPINSPWQPDQDPPLD